MKVTIASKSNEQTFNNLKVINIGTADNCNYKLNLDFDLILSLQQTQTGWQVVNNLRSERVLFRGVPVDRGLKIGSVCKLMIAGSDEFVSIKITNEDSLGAAVQPKSINQANTVRKTEPKKTITMIEQEELDEQDIQSLYGNTSAAQTKIKLDRRKADIEKTRAAIIKEISFKANDLRSKIAQNEAVLNMLNIFIAFVPLAMTYIMTALIKFDSSTGQLQNKILFLVAIAFIIITMMLKQGMFLSLQNKDKSGRRGSSVIIQRLSLFSSAGIFIAIIAACVIELVAGTHSLPVLIPQMLLFCTLLCTFLALFAGFTKNILTVSMEELDVYESREDFQSVLKNYQAWISLFVNNISTKKLKDINNKIFNLQIKSGFEYLLGIITAPFLAYGVSQTLAECFPEAAAWVRFSAGFKLSPIFLTLATLMIIFAFHCFATSFAGKKRVLASNVIKQDGFSDYNIHGVILHGVESTKNLLKESKKFLIIAIAVIFIEITMNVSYFFGVMGGDTMGMALSVISALVPTAILIMETNMLGNTKFEIIIREELLEKVDKDY